MSLACPQRRPQPGSWPWPGRLPRAPRPSPDTRSWPSVSARALLFGRRVLPVEPVPGRPQPPPIPLPHPGSTSGRSRLPLPARTPLYPPCAKPQSALQLRMVPLQRCQGPGVPWGEDVWAAEGVGPGARLLGLTVATSFRPPTPATNFPRLVSGVSVRGGTSKFPLLTLGRSPSRHPASRPLGLLAAPPTHGVGGCQGGNGGGRRSSDSPAHPP